MIIPLAAAYRLAKFNIDTRQTTGFIGIPTPMTGMVLASFAWMSYTSGYSGNIWILEKPLIDLSGLFSNYYVWLYMPLVASYMMISEILAYFLAALELSFIILVIYLFRFCRTLQINLSINEKSRYYHGKR